MTSNLLLDHQSDENTADTISTFPPAREFSPVEYGSHFISIQEPQTNYKLHLIECYIFCLDQYPLLTKMVTVGIVGLIGNTIAQALAGSGFCYFNFRSALSKFFVGTFFSAPFYHMLYSYLEERVPATLHYNRFIHMFVDQILAVPFWIACFFVLDTCLRGSVSWAIISQRFKQDFYNLLFTTWLIYPLAQYLNFTYAPERMRVLVLSSLSVLYMIVITLFFNGT